MAVEVTIKGDVERLHVGPDDLVVITLAGLSHEADFREAVEAVKARMPEAWRDRILFVAGNATVRVVTQT